MPQPIVLITTAHSSRWVGAEASEFNQKKIQQREKNELAHKGLFTKQEILSPPTYVLVAQYSFRKFWTEVMNGS